MQKAYNGMGMLNSSLNFIIPVYENMPMYPVQRPSILDSDYISENKKVIADVETYMNIRTGPSTSYEVLSTVTRNDVMTRIGKGIQKDEVWDKVILQNGILGYAFSPYLKEYTEPDNDVGVGVPDNPIPESEDTVINIEEKVIIINKELRVIENEISGIKPKETTANYIMSKITADFELTIYNSKDEIIEGEEKIGTGSRLVFTNEAGDVIEEFTFIMYGDVNGDGVVNTLDALVIQRHILEIKTILRNIFKVRKYCKKWQYTRSIRYVKNTKTYIRDYRNYPIGGNYEKNLFINFSIYFYFIIKQHSSCKPEV